MALSRQLFVDDRDPSITYGSASSGVNVWSQQGTNDEFMNTTTYTTVVGASAEITFSGALIAVYGTVTSTGLRTQPGDPTTQYFLDSDTPLSYQAQPTNGVQKQVRFYQSSPLSSGPHTLRIVVQSPGDFWLDYIVINGSVSTGPIDSTASSSSSQTSTHPLPTSTSASMPQSGSTTGLIISGALAGLFGLILLLLLAWCIRQRLYGKRSEKLQITSFHLPTSPPQSPMNQSSGSQIMTPFTSLPSRGDSVDAGGVSQVAAAGYGPTGRSKRWLASSQHHYDPPPDYGSEAGGSSRGGRQD
ncbi:hypothetical protein P691DRAFT_771724 [Macrolepiota fuliginosa MF-IS2]|uniref:Uncharacterized protein n=1 Tax=Macrolepiota fuliginosa MF-IS2 TaxID=1400762 RepID=A0A9P6C8R6_9AGAR|nr:hypothetical protein P691DRAFT_771724 [Macrolepiota fuliginosa MF-IS2]